MSDPTISLIQLDDAERHPALLAQVEAIFWETSARTFPPGPERDAFRERWLGRYLQGGSDVVLLALAGADTVAGYLVGALEDPAGQPRFADMSYFRTDFAALTQRFPAHLHINLAADFPQPGHRRAADRGFRRTRQAGRRPRHARNNWQRHAQRRLLHPLRLHRARHRPVERPRDRVPRPRALAPSPSPRFYGERVGVRGGRSRNAGVCRRPSP